MGFLRKTSSDVDEDAIGIARCESTWHGSRPRPPVVKKEIVSVDEDRFVKLRKEVPELAEFIEAFVSSRPAEDMIYTQCVLYAGHTDPHVFVVEWRSPHGETV